MKSRTSCCNMAILKRTAVKGLPLWGAYLLIWLALFPMSFYSGDRWMEALELRDYILSVTTDISQLFGAGYGLAAACLVFSHLYKSRSANFFGALPLTRHQQFLTQYLAGLLLAVVPYLIVLVLSVPAALIWDMMLLQDLAIWFVVMTLIYVFYYSFATMLAMIVGNLPALAVLYAVMNFTVVVLEAIIRELLQYFIYGLSFDGDFLFSWASPLFYTVLEGNGPYVDGIFDDVLSRTVDYVFVGWPIVLIMGAVGVAFAVVAYLLHKYRRMESAGDVIAVRHLKPVFLYCFTVGCSVVLGYVLSNLLLNASIGTEDFVPVLLCMAFGAWLGYFVGQMLLQKSMRVFHKRDWFNWAVTTLLIAAAMLCARFDVFGYAAYIPELEDIQSVSLAYNNDFSDDRDFIAQVQELHQACVDRQFEIEHADPEDGFFSYDIRYQLTDGSIVNRLYYVPYGREEAEDPNSLLNLFDRAINDPDYKMVRCLPEYYEAKHIQYCEIYNYHVDKDIHLTPEEAYTFLKTCLEPDLRESSMEEIHYYSKEPWENQETNIRVQLEFSRALFPDGDGDRYYHFSVTKDAERILAFAAEQGITPTEP